MASVEDSLTPALLQELRELWFGHVTSEDGLILPGKEDAVKWFKSDKEFDAICVERFQPTLDAIRAAGITKGQELVDVVKPSSPSDWLGLVLLLDQMPRNCYRGESAKLAFTVFDPLAQDISIIALDQHGVPNGVPELRWQIARRPWFYLPLMHSESRELHDKAVTLYEGMATDVEDLLAGKVSDDCKYRQRAASVVTGKAKEARWYINGQVGFEKKHYNIIKKFGRYPHRNEALGRKSTAEEVEYLSNGGETFSSS